MLKYLSADEAVRARLRRIPRGGVSFNYLGQFDQVLSSNAAIAVTDESSGPVQSCSNHLHYQLSINSIVRKGQLEVSWVYSKQAYEAATIEQVAESYMTGLREIITHCESAEVGGFTPSDFPEANLSQSDLDTFISRISKGVRE
jgi:non-ribosomal peptide synthase protein (TIGR01720 family)